MHTKDALTLISENIRPAFANHRLKTNAPNDWVIFKIHFSIIRNTRLTVFGIRISVQHSKDVCWSKLTNNRHYNRCTHNFANNKLRFLLDSLFAILGCMTKISTRTALCVQQNRTHNIAGAVFNIVAIEATLGSVVANFAEH